MRKQSHLSLEDAFQFVMNIKRANNLKERTLKDYNVYLRKFGDWVAEHYGEITVDQIEIDLLREYVVWCANEKTYYGGHPFKERMNKGKRVCRL
ncbi:hypothetical protein ACE1TI_13175 [Alteribacillus sp. JSM 102045]|uniref:hypothetical protein n=1 Tax=Alteribacillus sp. JSM 102045 TaxID=1562101 RepID=UPI0035BF3AAB